MSLISAANDELSNIRFARPDFSLSHMSLKEKNYLKHKIEHNPSDIAQDNEE